MPACTCHAGEMRGHNDFMTGVVMIVLRPVKNAIASVAILRDTSRLLVRNYAPGTLQLCSEE